MRRVFALLFFLLVPSVSLAAGQADFLNPRIASVQTSSLCTSPKNCQSLFFIKGKNFLNSNGKTGLKVGGEWAKILKVSDTQVVAVASPEAAKQPPIVTVDKTIRRPTLETNNKVLEKMFDESVDVALSAIQVAKDGSRYISAGPRYDNPARVYYRDTYWTSGMILMIEPYVVRDQILLLARGIGVSGSVPSAIPVDPADPVLPLWVDHVDSGPYFIMLVSDYIRWTGDTGILKEQVGGRNILASMESIITYLTTKDTNGNLLPDKPADSLQDWADTIPRGGEVISDEVLFAHAISEMGQLARVAGNKEKGRGYDRLFEVVRQQINERLWNEETNSYFERCQGDYCVERLTNESSLAALYDVIEPTNREVFFDRLLELETKRNPQLMYGDWGVVNVFPAYEGSRAYTYQNMTDWPFLDAMNAGARLKFGNADWEYPLTRWWTYFDEHRAEGARLPEFISPVDASAGDAQAWSVAPIVSFVKYGMGLDPGINGKFSLKVSPDGTSTLKNVLFRGRRQTLTTPEK